jgi:peptidoglycan/xylan/chitin deacetylase (PgdA/CDA1 family)
MSEMRRRRRKPTAIRIDAVYESDDDRGPPMTRCRLWAATLALVTVCLVPTATAAVWHPGGRVGAVQVVRLRLAQAGRDLVLELQFRRPAAPRVFSVRGGGGLCLFVAAAAGWRERACLGRRRHAWQVTVDGVREDRARVSWTGASLRLRVPIALATGPAEWALRLRAADCRARCVRRLPAYGHWTTTLSSALPRACEPVATAPAAGPSVALTFDDGPSPDTAALLGELEALGVPATFFVIGRQVPGSEQLLGRMLTDGDVIGNHTWDHVDVSRGGADAAAQLERTSAAIAAATGGFRPCLFRPPYGRTGRRLDALVQGLGMQTVLWSVDPRDWSQPGTATIVRRVVSAARPGAIILLHDGGGPRRQTLAAVPAIVNHLRASGYRFRTVPALLAPV